MDRLQEIINDLANNKEVFFKVKVIPGQDKTELREPMADGTLKIALAAIPEKGKANQELINFLAELLNLHKYQLAIISGPRARAKLVRVRR